MRGKLSVRFLLVRIPTQLHLRQRIRSVLFLNPDDCRTGLDRPAGTGLPASLDVTICKNSAPL